MRPPFVKRHTAPESGLFRFFPPWQGQRGQQSVWCPDLIPVPRCQPSMAAPPTYRGSLITDVMRAEPRGGDSLRPRNDSVPSYRPIQEAGCACRARQLVPGSGERQHTRTLCKPTLHGSKPARASNQPRGLRDAGPMHAWAFKDAAKSDIRRARCRLIPLESSSAPGSPALLPEDCRNRSISKAVWRLSM
jgi:hypothetical protein